MAEEIQQKSPLVSLSLNRHQALDDDLLLQLAKWNPNLNKISMNDSYRITDSGLSHLFKHCPSLFSLDISNCLLLTKECLKDFPDALLEISLNGLAFVNEEFFNMTMPYLETLSIQNTPLTAKGLKKLSSFAPSLMSLYLSYSNFNMGEIRDSIEYLPLWMLHIEDCYSLSNEDAHKILIPHPYLRFLSLINCHRLTDALFHSLQDFHIKYLSLKDVPNLTDNGLEKILNLPIDYLHVMDCPKLTNRSLELAKEYSPKFQELRVSCLNL